MSVVAVPSVQCESWTVTVALWLDRLPLGGWEAEVQSLTSAPWGYKQEAQGPGHSACYLPNRIKLRLCQTAILKGRDVCKSYDFKNKVNVLMSYLSCASSHTFNVLFSAYCMTLYGICQWDLTSTNCERFYTTLRKAVWRINRLKPRTHNDLLHDVNVETINFLPSAQ